MEAPTSSELPPLVNLAPFGRSPFNVSARVQRLGTELHFEWVISGDLQRLVVPEELPRRPRTVGLWTTTCLEAFFGPAGSDAYWELNVSPSGAWNVFRFEHYRSQPMKEEGRVRDIRFDRLRIGDRELAVRCSFDAPFAQGPLQASLTAVVAEAPEGRAEYFALRHCGRAPDFHARPSFVLPVP
eukprot:tig00020528_g9981.t1